MADAHAADGDVPADAPELGPATVQLLSRACGVPLAAFAPAHVARTVERTVQRQGLRGPGALADALVADDDLRVRFRRAVAVSTTAMFRDADQFDLLSRQVPVLRAMAGGGPLRVWSAGASEGSEACSVALLLDRAGDHGPAEILGSDLLAENVRAARARADGRLPSALRARVRFEQRDVRRSAPRGPWHLVLCRNLVIHLTAAARRQVLDVVAGAVAPGGLLLLGRSERTVRTDGLALVEVGPNLYRRSA
ncbi:CheR family methyltransferase [Patulibacter sp. SYSU D01012]|uniref:CheR family methyltransferase n=1 Tax=Patulibacter sp. SYSU D01012 TaxID=2817381 RepID=UPI001B30BDCA